MDEDLKEYVERWCRCYQCTEKEALQEQLVKEVGQYYKDERRYRE